MLRPIEPEARPASASPSRAPRSGRAAGSRPARAARAPPAHGRRAPAPAAPPRPMTSRSCRAGTARVPAIVCADCGMADIGDRPVFGSTPPQKLIGAVSTSASPAPADARHQHFGLDCARPAHARSSVSTAACRRPRSPRSRPASRRARHSRYCPARNARTCRNWSSARRPAGSGRIGVTTTQVSATMTTPQAFQRLAPAVALERGEHMAAGAGVERHARACGPPISRSSVVEFGERQMRAADRHRVDAAAAASRSTAALRASATIAARDVDHRLGGCCRRAPSRGRALRASRRRCGTGRPRRTRRPPRRTPSARPRRDALATPVTTPTASPTSRP